MSLSIEHLNNLRTRIAAGEEVPPDEVREALLELRQQRTELSKTKKPKKAASAPPVDISKLLDF